MNAIRIATAIVTIADTASACREIEARLTDCVFASPGRGSCRRPPGENARVQPTARRTRAVLLDALGTLVALEPPATHLAAGLGIADDERLAAAVRAEMAYYRDHSDEGRDPASLAELRRRCAAVLSAELGREVAVEELMASIRFRAFDDAAPALSALRRRRLRVVCVSNWDYALPEVLDRIGLAALLDGVVTSAAVGARKPDPAIFAAGLEAAGCGAAEALHVGDSSDEDIAGASAAGIRALLIDRSGGGDISSLAELPAALGI
jgi:putative hydrolase of the HAD superfamily